MIIAFGDNVLIEDVNIGPEKHGNFYIPPTSSQKVKIGKVITIGNSKEEKFNSLKAGDMIFYDPSSTKNIVSEGREFKIIKLGDVLAISSKDNESD